MTFIHVWPVGLVGWFSLWVPEVPGSTPGQPQIVFLFKKNRIDKLLAGSIPHQSGCSALEPCSCFQMSLHMLQQHLRNTSNTKKCFVEISKHREERVENTTRSGVFLTKFDRGVWEANENTVLSFWYIFSIEARLWFFFCFDVMNYNKFEK